ncbi:hypothetical protein KPP03845_200136 (plasmid) [Streptomyces xanthophaeus]|nr:hypothetical protein KPP03845_200136 [Streptomyces xanthophaeus]
MQRPQHDVGCRGCQRRGSSTSTGLDDSPQHAALRRVVTLATTT